MAGLIAVVTSVCGPLLVAAHAAQNTQEVIFCGTPLARQLMPGATNTFKTSLLPGTVVSTDIIDTDNIGVLKLQAVNFSPATETCSGELLLTTLGEAGTINVTDCFGSSGHNYTIALSVVSQGPDNCAVPLPCRTPVSTTFAIAGEVDSYTFPGVQGEQVSLAVTNLNPPGGVRLRLFDPTGAKIYDDNDQGTCPGSLQKQLLQTGTYTALISSCMGTQTGQYTVTWVPERCGPTQPPGQFAYVANADSGTLSVIDLSTNTARLSIPITPPGRAEAGGTPTFVAITPNGGFAWATYGTSSTTSLVNTGTNLLMASVPTGLDTNGLAISADGATVYVLSNSLGGVALIDTKTNKVTRVAALDPGSYQGLAIATSSEGTFLYLIEDDDNNAGLVKISIQEDYIRVGFAPLDLGSYDAFAVSPDGSFIYAGFFDGIAVIDTTTFLKTMEITVGEPFAIAFTPDGLTAYVTSADDGTVAAIDTAMHTVTKTIPVTDNPGGIAIAPDTLLAYVTDFAAAASDPGVFVLDTRTNKIIASTPSFGDGPSSIALTTAPTGLCVGDSHGETQVTVDEIVLSVNYLLNGCPGRFPSVPFP